jgi:hypothetical protein
VSHLEIYNENLRDLLAAAGACAPELYICIYVYIICMYTHTHVYTHMCMYTCVCVCVCVVCIYIDAPPRKHEIKHLDNGRMSSVTNLRVVDVSNAAQVCMCVCVCVWGGGGGGRGGMYYVTNLRVVYVSNAAQVMCVCVCVRVGGWLCGWLCLYASGGRLKYRRHRTKHTHTGG